MEPEASAPSYQKISTEDYSIEAVRERNVVVAFDATEDSLKSLAYAVKNIYRKGDVFHLVHVVKCLEPPLEIFHGPPGSSFNFENPDLHVEKAQIERARQYIREKAVPTLDEHNIPYQTHLYADQTTAPPKAIGDIIAKVADEVGASLIVLARSNKTGLQTWYLGSVAKYCTQLPYNVFLVK